VQSAKGVELVGVALHGGHPSRIVLTRAVGPIVLARHGAEARLDELCATRTDHGVTAASADGRIAIDLVEHLLAALGGLGVREGVRVSVDDGEPPLLDGGARRFAEALVAIGAPLEAPPGLRITRPATLSGGGASTYRFLPGTRTRLHVAVRFRAPIGDEEASWDGDPRDFLERIAPARTFGWVDEHAALLAKGRARGVDLDGVLVLSDAGPVAGCRPNEPGEIARHKLLDLIGDLTLHGGVPEGTIEAFAPGHGATHRVMAEALRTGILLRIEAETRS
jgi:UDP-3-O-[3-hydroxymyristoyl] N-acetylglucosamine deacetylase